MTACNIRAAAVAHTLFTHVQSDDSLRQCSREEAAIVAGKLMCMREYLNEGAKDVAIAELVHAHEQSSTAILQMKERDRLHVHMGMYCIGCACLEAGFATGGVLPVVGGLSAAGGAALVLLPPEGAALLTQRPAGVTQLAPVERGTLRVPRRRHALGGRRQIPRPCACSVHAINGTDAVWAAA